MLFRKKQSAQCAHCRFSCDADGGMRLCRKKGPVPQDGSCRSFRYDPLQRRPLHAKPLDFSRYDQEDFSL